jgi:hypothetical protein
VMTATMMTILLCFGCDVSLKTSCDVQRWTLGKGLFSEGSDLSWLSPLMGL